MKMGKTLHPKPYTPHPTTTEKLFAADPNWGLLNKSKNLVG